MSKKSTKASRKYSASGRLKKEIQARKRHQQTKKKTELRKSGRSGRDHGSNVNGPKENKVASKHEASNSDEESDEDSENEGMEENGKTKLKFVYSL